MNHQFKITVGLLEEIHPKGKVADEIITEISSDDAVIDMKGAFNDKKPGKMLFEKIRCQNDSFRQRYSTSCLLASSSKVAAMKTLRRSHFCRASRERCGCLGDDRIQAGVVTIPKRDGRSGHSFILVLYFENGNEPAPPPKSLQQGRNSHAGVLIGDALHRLFEFWTSTPIRCFSEQAVSEEHTKDANQRVHPQPTHAGELANGFGVQENAEDHDSKHFIQTFLEESLRPVVQEPTLIVDPQLLHCRAILSRLNIQNRHIFRFEPIRQ